MLEPLGITDAVAAIALGTIDYNLPIASTIDVSSKVVDESLVAALGTFVPVLDVLPALC